MDRFNYHMMNLARDARGITQADLARRMQVGQGTLSKYETGIAQPPSEFLTELSRILGFPPSFFYTAGRPYGFPPFHYRRRKKLSKKALDRIVAEMNIRRIHVEKLVVSYEQKTNGFIPEIDRSEYHGGRKEKLNIESVARTVRE